MLLEGVGPEIFKIFLQHVVVNVYKISNHSEVVMFWLGEMVWNAENGNEMPKSYFSKASFLRRTASSANGND